MEALEFISVTFGMCFLIALPGVLIEHWLVQNDLVPNRMGWVMFTAICGVAIKILWFQQVSWWVLAPAIILASILGVHRGDLWATMKRGKRWWKSN